VSGVPKPLSERDAIAGPLSPLTALPRAAEVSSTLAAQRLRRGAVAASLALHGGALLALVLIALWGVPPPEPPVIRVTLSEGPGAAGAIGGGNGGGPQQTNTAPAAASSAPTPAAPPSPEPPAATAEAPPAPPPPEPQPAPQPAPAPQQLAAAPPPPPMPTPPRRKPAPPRPAAAEAIPAPTPQPLAAAPPAATPGAPGEGSGPGGTAGAGTGAEGAGHGAIGDGPVEGPGDDYLDRLRRWLERYKRYPDAAKQAKQQGRLVVGFTILRDGTVRDARIERSSGFPLLDQAALQMLRDASPVPPLPQAFHGERVGIDLPVDFSIGLLDRLF
jgi:protein TonB